jgi:hypothetical protein
MGVDNLHKFNANEIPGMDRSDGDFATYRDAPLILPWGRSRAADVAPNPAGVSLEHWAVSGDESGWWLRPYQAYTPASCAA